MLLVHVHVAMVANQCLHVFKYMQIYSITYNYSCRNLSWVKIFNVKQRYEANQIDGKLKLIDTLPYLKVPLHTIMKLTPVAYGNQ